MKAENNKPAELLTRGPWQIPYKAVRVLCPDGKRRTAKTAPQADTYFSLPASVQFKGKTVSGYITGRETKDGQQDYEFIPYIYRKNHAIFEQEPKQ